MSKITVKNEIDIEEINGEENNITSRKLEISSH